MGILLEDCSKAVINCMKELDKGNIAIDLKEKVEVIRLHFTILFLYIQFIFFKLYLDL